MGARKRAQQVPMVRVLCQCPRYILRQRLKLERTRYPGLTVNDCRGKSIALLLARGETTVGVNSRLRSVMVSVLFLNK